MNRLLVAIIFLGIACSASSCNLWRKVTGRRKAVPVADSTNIVLNKDSVLIPPDTLLVKRDTATVIPAPAADSQAQALLQQWLPLWTAQTLYTTFSGKAKVHYEGGGKEEDFTAAIRIEKDKRIWIAITGSFLGLTMEGARILITPDTIIALDRIHKEVRVLPFAEADKLLPVHADFGTLQSLLIGEVLPAGTLADHAAETNDTIVLSVSKNTFAQLAVFNKQDTTLIHQSLIAELSKLHLDYSDYKKESNHRFAHARTFFIINQNEPHNITLEFTKAAFNEPVDMSFSIPSKYERK